MFANQLLLLQRTEFLNSKFVLEALELLDTIKNYESRDSTGWFALKSTCSYLS
ncbi:hypothetical protein Ahy_B10g105255 [Arachis hypogaea]|uniref:Uncharacterized protein n=1 Tax=Arachis hypogaea TaxID=3818 RepID=A0A444X801_ARAHY|nr:hypothetical protein Ahy_B10g105255 [Arachis hypogaea]